MLRLKATQDKLLIVQNITGKICETLVEYIVAKRSSQNEAWWTRADFRRRSISSQIDHLSLVM